MSSEKPFTFDNNRPATEEQTPHSGVHHDEKPFDRKARISPDTRPDIPKMMTYTDDERQLARSKQAEFDAQKAKEEKQAKKSRRRKIVAGATAAISIPAVISVGYMVKQLYDLKEATEPLNEPGLSGPVTPGEIENEPASEGIQLSPEELADFTSGDPERIADVVDERMLPSIRAAINPHEEATPEPGIFDAKAQKVLDGIVVLIEERREGDSSEYFGTYICPMNPEEGTCEDGGLETSITPDAVELGAAIKTLEYPGSTNEGYRVNFTIPQLSATLTPDGKFYFAGNLDK